MRGRRPGLLLVPLQLLLLLHPPPAAAAAASERRRCQPQGLLRLEEPRPWPQRVALPFCESFGCSCCNASHALAIARAFHPVSYDEDLSPGCRSGLLLLACRLCDPEVGTGAKPTVCPASCDSIFEACAQDFFMYDPSSGHVVPCDGDGLVCSQLSELASSGAEFCKAAGHPSGGEGPCYDGTPVPAAACPPAPPKPPAKPPRQQHGSSSKPRGAQARSSWLGWWPWRLKRKHRRRLGQLADAAVGLATTSLVAWLLNALLRRVMRPRLHRPPGAPPRDVLARAAEVRRRGQPGEG